MNSARFRGLWPPRADRAQSLLEFALVIPALLLMLFGVLEVGRFRATADMVAQAARAGAHAGSFVSVKTDAPIIDAANKGVPLLGTLPASAVVTEPLGTDRSGPGRTKGGTITVTVTSIFRPTLFFAQFVGSSVPLSATSVQPVE